MLFAGLGQRLTCRFLVLGGPVGAAFLALCGLLLFGLVLFLLGGLGCDLAGMLGLLLCIVCLPPGTRILCTGGIGSRAGS